MWKLMYLCLQNDRCTADFKVWTLSTESWKPTASSQLKKKNQNLQRACTEQFSTLFTYLSNLRVSSGQEDRERDLVSPEQK